MKIAYVVLALPMLIGGCEKSRSVVPDSALILGPHDCAVRSGITEKKFCRVSIYSMLGSSSEYAGKIVEVVGYVGVIDDVPYLFPTEDSLRRLDIASGIELVDAPSFTEGWYSVLGTFSNKDQKAEGMAYGSLKVEILRPR